MRIAFRMQRLYREVFRFLVVLALVLPFGLVPPVVKPALAATTNLTVVSDNSTLVVVGNVPGASYPHSAVVAWQPYDPANNHWDTTITGHHFPNTAKWIWESYRVINPVTGNIVDFRKDFSIPGNPVAGTLHITGDNGYELRVNGTLVGSAQLAANWRTSNMTENFVHTDGWESAESWDIISHLVQGANRIEIAAANEYYGPLDGQSDGTVDHNPAGLIFEADITYEKVLPTVTTGNATSVEGTTATLNGTLTGDGGETCQYRFEYDTDPGASYSFSTPWMGNIATGQSFTVSISSLSKGTKYYFVAEAKNSAGISIGLEQHLLTRPDPPVSVSASVVSGASVTLSWTKGEGANRTMIRRKTGSYPVDVNDGVQVYFDTGTSLTDSGLTSNTTYYYKSWSEVTGSQQWSDGFAVVIVTTESGSLPTPPVTVGGRVYRVSKAEVLAPYLILLLIITAIIAIGLYLRKRFAVSPVDNKRL